MKYNRLD